jgi:hypothetical protein
MKSFIILHSSLKVISVIKTRRVRLEVACSMHVKDEKHVKILIRKPQRKSPLGKLSIKGRITLK